MATQKRAEKAKTLRRRSQVEHHEHEDHSGRDESEEVGGHRYLKACWCCGMKTTKRSGACTQENDLNFFSF
jgi:hypothetical protein